MERSVPVLVPPSRPTPFEVLPLTHGSVMAGLNTLVSTHMLVFKPSKQQGGARPADIIRSGLSQVLVPYYPLAGRIVENETGWEVQCDGRGAVFIVTTVPDFEEIVFHGRPMIGSEVQGPAETILFEPPTVTVGMIELEPEPEPQRPQRIQAPALTVQVTELGCGGFILSIKLCRGVCDAAGLMHFLCGWAEMARGKPNVSVTPVWGDKGGMQTRPWSTVSSDDNNMNGHRIHFPSLQMGSGQLDDPDRGTLTCPHPSRAYRPITSDRVKLDIPLDLVTSLFNWLHVEEGCDCNMAQALAAHVWRERTRALQIPHDADARLFFMCDARENHPIGYYGSFTFNCQAMARASDLVELPLSYAVRRIQAAESSLFNDFTACTKDFKRLHCSCGSAPPEVLVFTNLPTATNVDTQLDFGVLGTPDGPSELAHFPSQVNIAAISPRHDSMLQIIMNNVPFVYIDDLRSLICNMPFDINKHASRM